MALNTKQKVLLINYNYHPWELTIACLPLVTQPMLQRRPNPMELRSMDSYIQNEDSKNVSKKFLPKDE